VARVLHPERRYLFVIDGAEALRVAIERVFGEGAEVQRCQIYKRRDVKEHLPKSAQRGRRAGGNPHRASAGCGRTSAQNLGVDQPDRTLPFHRRARRTECETLASRGPCSALDGHRIVRSGEVIRASERLPGTGNPAARTESVIRSAGPGRVTCSPPRAAAFN